MTLYFPDVNIWIALSFNRHAHNDAAMRWIRSVRREDRLLFSRYTQLGLLRLLTNSHVVNPPLNVTDAWSVYDRWLADPRIEFAPEPRTTDTAFRQATAPFSSQASPQWIGDCYLLAYARETDAVLVTFDQALHKLAASMRYAAIIPDGS